MTIISSMAPWKIFYIFLSKLFFSGNNFFFLVKRNVAPSEYIFYPWQSTISWKTSSENFYFFPSKLSSASFSPWSFDLSPLIAVSSYPSWCYFVIFRYCYSIFLSRNLFRFLFDDALHEDSSWLLFCKCLSIIFFRSRQRLVFFKFSSVKYL